jgi:hypothetical protein
MMFLQLAWFGKSIQSMEREILSPKQLGKHCVKETKSSSSEIENKIHIER